MEIAGVSIWENYIDTHHIDRHQVLFEQLQTGVDWEKSMQSRWTASYGEPYNYSQMVYPKRLWSTPLGRLRLLLADTLGFLPNNCLLNYYQGEASRMGYHSDETKDLEEGCGIAIISLGGIRTLRFRSIANPTITHDYRLASGTLLYMTQEVQHLWQHAVPKAKDPQPRISLTYRRFKEQSTAG